MMSFISKRQKRPKLKQHRHPKHFCSATSPLDAKMHPIRQCIVRQSTNTLLRRRYVSSTSNGNGPLSEEKRKAFQATLNMPKTKLKPRFGGAVREPNFQSRCTSELYQWQQKVRENRENFILHDGPPYANGDLHLGHLMNKTLKDFINRKKLLSGKQVHYIPGWDCHGLPIELKALEKLRKGKKSKSFDSADPLQVRQVARDFAKHAVENQTKDFKRWGIMADWEAGKISAKSNKTDQNSASSKGYYTTMDQSYELSQLGVFSDLVEAGLVYRGLKPVYWSPSTMTALAEAELEYPEGHESPAAFVGFRVTDASQKKLDLGCQGATPCDLRLLVWTTTPWTLAANSAVCVNENASYSVVRLQGPALEATRELGRQHWIVAADLVEQLEAMAFTPGLPGDWSTEHSGKILEVVAEVPGKELLKLEYQHPVPSPDAAACSYPVLHGDHVLTDSGTGLVHTAPAHGQEDFEAWTAGGKAVGDAPRVVDEQGRYSFASDAECSEGDVFWKTLHGQHVIDSGSESVLQYLKDKGTLLHTYPFAHRYPYDWRSKKPVILRLADQWFVDVGSLRAAAHEALDDVKVVPQVSKSRLLSMMDGRVEWCISRQRAWGVPIPAFYDHQGNPVLDPSTVAHVAQVLRTHPLGMDAWWKLSVEELLPEELMPQHREHPFTKEVDTLDVWFDSGCSWKGVLSDQGLGCRADVYLEGSDQHRGWFQSSLLTKLGATKDKESPYATVITHGFLLDENGRKMSKSLGNVLAPNDLINGKKHKFGVDVLRLWVASCDFTGDAPVGPTVLSKVGNDLAKIRHTFRYMLGALGDFDPKVQSLDIEQLEPVDRYLLDRLAHTMKSVSEGYDEYNFRSVYSNIMRFISQELSAIYISSTKDRLRADSSDSATRRACQTTLWHTLECLLLAIAPITCHMAEDIYDHSKVIGALVRHDQDVKMEQELDINGEPFSVFQHKWPVISDDWLLNDKDEKLWADVLGIRHLVHHAIKNSPTPPRSNESAIVHVEVLDNNQGEKLVEALSTMTGTRDGVSFTSPLALLLMVADIRVDVLNVEHRHSTEWCIDQTLESALCDSTVNLRIRVGDGSLNDRLQKCDRCWMYSNLEAGDGEALCARCSSVVASL